MLDRKPGIRETYGGALRWVLTICVVGALAWSLVIYAIWRLVRALT